MAFLNDPITHIKFEEFKRALLSIDTDVVVKLLHGWGKKYFKELDKEFLDQIRRFLATIVHKIGEEIE